MSFTHGGTFCGGGVDEGVGLDCGHRNIVSYPSGGVMPHGSVSGMTSLSTAYRFLLTPVGAPVAWGPRIIDTADTAVAMSLKITHLLEERQFF
ncbi:hypothetical protein TNCV_3776291 [Trichonephila clavipes]|nr:hypothetical protein TNCV_3776291 [Trichonephila clavipes]